MCLIEPRTSLAADHYGPAEILFVRRILSRHAPYASRSLHSQGEFRQKWPEPGEIFGATKWCVFRKVEPTRALVEGAVNERLERMKSHRVDLLQVRLKAVSQSRRLTHYHRALQFHWQDYDDPGYLTAMHHLSDLRNEGKIAHIGLCNFDTVRMDEICSELGHGVVVSNQVQVSGYEPYTYDSFQLTFSLQFSLVDIRPLYAMAEACHKHNVKLLTYGTMVSSYGCIHGRG